ncbi:MAG TPA: DNA polymerase III subunit delta', partial [Acetobacteraceae bacterium]
MSEPPEPRANPTLIGHDSAEATLLGALGGARMHHAWMITGPEGVGKATLAFRFARRLLAGASAGGTLALDPAHPVARRIAAGGHADLFTLRRTIGADGKKLRNEIGVDDVRAVSAFLRLTPAEGGWRVVIVDRADELNRNAANALLKILEEPPPRALLLLVCASPGRLPITLRSRCRRLALRPLSDADMARLLALDLPEVAEDERARLIALAEGSPGRALLLRDAHGLALAGLVDQVLAALPDLPGAGWEVADRLGRADGGFSTFMDLLRAAIAAAVRAAARGQADPEQARLAGLHPLDAWADVWHALTRLQDET